MIATPTSPPAGRHYPSPVVLAAAVATVAILAAGGVRQVDDTFAHRYRSCDLLQPETCIADLATVAPSPIGMLQWNPGSILQADVGTVAPGDVIKINLASSGDRQRVQVLIDETPVATVTVDESWHEHELIAPVAGSTVRLRRDGPAGGPLHRQAVAAAGPRGTTRLLTSRRWLLVTRGLQPEQWSVRAFATIAAGAAMAFAAAAAVLMPRSPFEWDEVLFLAALDHFDVAAHAPHPPGYPVYVAAARLADALLHDPVRSLQLVSIGGALLALVATGLVMRRLAAPRGPVLLAGVLLAATPAFAFYANVGMADALATGVATAALWACAGLVGEEGHARRLVALAALTAVAVGVRPQVFALLAGPGLWALARAVLDRRWLGLVAATATGAAVSAVCWGPVIALTGWHRYLGAVHSQHRWMMQYEQGGHLPDAALASLAEQWLVRPFGTSALALALWLLVVVGAVLWWRRGERRLVLFAGLAAGGYLLAAA